MKTCGKFSEHNIFAFVNVLQKIFTSDSP